MSRQMYIMDVLTRRGSAAQKERFLPELAAGRLRLAGIRGHGTDHGVGHDPAPDPADKHGDRYVVHGQKVFTSRIMHSDLMLLLVRTTPVDQVERKTQGLSILMVDLAEANGRGIEVRPLQTMLNHHTCEIFLDGLEVPASNLIGEEGDGFRALAGRTEHRAHRLPPSAWATARGSWARPAGMRTSESSSADPSARTKASSFRSPRPTRTSRQLI